MIGIGVVSALVGACSSDHDPGAVPDVPAVTVDPVGPHRGDTSNADGAAADSGPGSDRLHDPDAPDGTTDEMWVLPEGRPEATGDGVVVVIVDSGVDWRHPDLRRVDGSTRLAAVVDLTGQTAGCTADRPGPTVYLADEIDRRLAEDDRSTHVDVVGRGTALAGLAAGNGAASGGLLAGAAPDAAIIVVKQVSEGVPPSALGEGGPPVVGCLDDALDQIDELLLRLDAPAVLLAPTGAQWGPLDGTSAASRRLERSFGPDTPGRVLVTGAGDEGGRANHAQVELTADDPVATIPFDRPRAERSNPTLWYAGEAEVFVSVRFDGDDGVGGSDGVVVGPVGPGGAVDGEGVRIVHYGPGTQFHPWTSTADDRAVWFLFDRPAGSGEILVELVDEAHDGATVVDVFGDLLGPDPGASSIEFTDHLAPARVTDVASTRGAVVVTAHVARIGWIDRRGRSIQPSPSIGRGEVWPGASSGPTRDGRQVVAVSAPGQHAIGPLADGSVLAGREELHPSVPGGDPDARYVVVTGTGPAAAIVTGVVAAMLEVSPGLTATEIRTLLGATADDGRVDAIAAVDAARRSSGS